MPLIIVWSLMQLMYTSNHLWMRTRTSICLILHCLLVYLPKEISTLKEHLSQVGSVGMPRRRNCRAGDHPQKPDQMGGNDACQHPGADDDPPWPSLTAQAVDQVNRRCGEVEI